MRLDVGVVVIGRNEGERLRRCLKSVIGRAELVVYVDSGSTDGSTAMARDIGATVVELDMSAPFTAARARNQGFRRLRELAPDIAFVQFVDGDCEVAEGWVETARDFLDRHPEAAIVCGRRRERQPGLSVYNRLCDIEWDTPIGEARYCGGDALVRSVALRQVGGYRGALIAGEEPELCLRLRAAGWRIWRLDAEMTLHDANMTRFGQWWKRSVRCGHAFAEGADLHGAPPDRHYVRESRRAWTWGIALPALFVALTALDVRFGLLFLLYPLQVLRLTLASRLPSRQRGWHALFLVLGKFPEAQGLLKYRLNRLRNKTATLVEYK